MSVKYIKDNKTQEVIYPITKSECIIDAHSINEHEIDLLFDESPEYNSSNSGMDYLNYGGLQQYHKKILEEIKTGLGNVLVDLTGYATELWVENKGYLTEHLDISGKVDNQQFEEATLVITTNLNNKQDKEDNSLLTSNKTVIGAINEIKLIVDISIPLLQASL